MIIFLFISVFVYQYTYSGNILLCETYILKSSFFLTREVGISIYEEYWRRNHWDFLYLGEIITFFDLMNIQILLIRYLQLSFFNFLFWYYFRTIEMLNNRKIFTCPSPVFLKYYFTTFALSFYLCVCVFYCCWKYFSYKKLI